MNKILFLLLLFIPLLSFTQNSELSIFDNLIGKRWSAEGNWEDGSVFKQEVTLEYALNNTLIIARSNGFTDEAQTKFGARNHGLRQYDASSKSIKFWEFDVFGGLTEGVVFNEGKNIIYQYEYGGSTITDMWEYVDDYTYNFIVGNYENGNWKQKYLTTQFVARR